MEFAEGKRDLMGICNVYWQGHRFKSNGVWEDILTNKVVGFNTFISVTMPYIH